MLQTDRHSRVRMPNPFLNAQPKKGGWNHSNANERPQKENPFLTNRSSSGSSFNSSSFNSFSAMADPSPPLPPPAPQPSFDESFPSLNQMSKPQPPTPVPKLNFKSAVQHAQSNQPQTPQTPQTPQSNYAHAQSTQLTQNGQYKNPFLHPVDKFLQSGQFGQQFGQCRPSRVRHDNECEREDVYDDAYDSAYTKYYDD